MCPTGKLLSFFDDARRAWYQLLPHLKHPIFLGWNAIVYFKYSSKLLLTNGEREQFEVEVGKHSLLPLPSYPQTSSSLLP